MAKKKQRSKYSSKGLGSNVTADIKKAVRREITYIDRMINQLDAWSKGRRTMVTIPNPNPNETNKRYIRQEGNIVFGPWKRTMEGSK